MISFLAAFVWWVGLASVAFTLALVALFLVLAVRDRFREQCLWEDANCDPLELLWRLPPAERHDQQRRRAA